MGVGGVSPTPRPPIPPGKTRYPLYRRLGGSQGRSGRAENLVPTGIWSRTVQPIVSRYTDSASRLTHLYTAWFKTRDSISYVCTPLTINGMWMIDITFERGGPKFSNTTARALAYRTAMRQSQLREKWLLYRTRFFAFVSSLKLSRWLLCSVRFVFVSTFNLQRGRAFVVGITNLSK